MSRRCLTFAFLLPLLAGGCMTQRDAADREDDEEVDDAAEVDTVTTHGGAPNIAVYIYGTWDFTATRIGGDDTLTGVLTIAEASGASHLALSDGTEARLAIEGLEVTNANFMLSGTAQGAEPRSVGLVGSLAGDEMTAEAEIGEGGPYMLTATRRTP